MSKVVSALSEITRAQKAYEGYFASPENIPVSFAIGGKTYTGFGGEFEISREKLGRGVQVATSFQGLNTYLSLSDWGEKITARHPSGLTVIVKTAVYENYGAFEWMVSFRNDGEENSPILSDVLSASLEFEGENPFLEHFIGDDYADRHAMMPEMCCLRPGMRLELQPVGGRPTNFRLPFYRLTSGENSTVISVGWSGQWKAVFDTRQAQNCVRFTAGQATFRAYLTPGEEIRTPMMTLLYADGRVDEEEAKMRMINLWRRFLIDCNMRRIEGELMQPASVGSTAWIYHEMRDSTDENQIAAIDFYHNNGLPLDYWWMDAGWYFKGENERIESWVETGSWKMDTNRFPSEMKDVSDHARALGTKTLLWFEPERITPNTFLAGQTRWQISPQLIDMANPEFRAWLQERVFKVLERGGMSLYRQDFNIDPLPHWQQADLRRGPDRDGVSENHYITGYLSYWDAIIERFPHMMIDSCASGGRRNDLETMRRSVSVHKTDADYSDFTRKQAMNQSFYQWLPYFGTLVVGPTYQGTIEKMAFRSALVPWFAYTYDVRLDPAVHDLDSARTMMQEWKEHNGCFYGDYYPLTEWSVTEDKWLGWEFYDAEKQEGVVQLFRRKENEEAEKTFIIRGVDEEKNYHFKDCDGRMDLVISGKELLTKGLTVSIPQKHDSALIHFSLC